MCLKIDASRPKPSEDFVSGADSSKHEVSCMKIAGPACFKAAMIYFFIAAFFTLLFPVVQTIGRFVKYILVHKINNITGYYFGVVFCLNPSSPRGSASSSPLAGRQGSANIQRFLARYQVPSGSAGGGSGRGRSGSRTGGQPPHRSPTSSMEAKSGGNSRSAESIANSNAFYNSNSAASGGGGGSQRGSGRSSGGNKIFCSFLGVSVLQPHYRRQLFRERKGSDLSLDDSDDGQSLLYVQPQGRQQQHHQRPIVPVGAQASTTISSDNNVGNMIEMMPSPAGAARGAAGGGEGHILSQRRESTSFIAATQTTVTAVPAVHQSSSGIRGADKGGGMVKGARSAVTGGSSDTAGNSIELQQRRAKAAKDFDDLFDF